MYTETTIVRAVRGHRGNFAIDLIEQTRDFGDITDVIRRQFHRNDFLRLCIDAKTQFAPTTTRGDTVFLANIEVGRYGSSYGQTDDFAIRHR